jgi:8-amino-7-oxononanoate synthase
MPFKQLKKSLSSHIMVDDKSYLYFGGTAYLGIPQNEEFIRHYVEGIKKFGLNNGTSRGNNVQLEIYDEAEKFAANKFGSQDCLITSSGYLAAQLAIKSISNFGELRYAPDTHPALWLNGDPKTTGSFRDWAMLIVDEINTSKIKNWVIVSNSMNNLYPEIYDFSFIKNIVIDKQVILLVDDAHGIGINNNGLSALSSIPTGQNIEILIVASMAKALGVDAGLVLGSAQIISQLKSTNYFLGASPPSAAGLFAFMQSDKIYTTELDKLKNNMLALSKPLQMGSNWQFIPEFPVFLSKNADISRKLLEQDIVISSFPYPKKDSEILNRIVLSSWHTQADIQKLIASL